MRFEQKFLLSVEESADLSVRFDLLFQRDPYCGSNGTYSVLSQYYDSRDLDFYYAKVNGDSDQIKIRARKYSADLLDSSPVFLEAKVKTGDIQRKVRVCGGAELLNREEWCKQTDQGRFFDGLVSQLDVQPVTTVFYQRRAYFLECEGLSYRLNIDENILCFPPEVQQVNADTLEWACPQQEFLTVLEIKSVSRRMPWMITNELKRHHLVPQTASKYQLSVEKIYGRTLHD